MDHGSLFNCLVAHSPLRASEGLSSARPVAVGLFYAFCGRFRKGLVSSNSMDDHQLDASYC